MPRRATQVGTPRDHAPGFPDGPIPVDAPDGVAHAAEIARRLRAALEGKSISAVCRNAGLNRSTVQDLIAGRTFADTVTLAKLERVLGVRLWPD